MYEIKRIFIILILQTESKNKIFRRLDQLCYTYVMRVMKDEKVISIHYILVDDSVHEGKATIYHLLDRSLVYHLRFFMTLMLLPSDTISLDTQKPTFSAAFHRLTTPPLILRAPAEGKFEDWQWSFLKKQLLLILVVNGQIPKWGVELAGFKPIGLLSPSERVLEEANKEGCFHVGLLRGFTDVVEAYRVIGELVSLYTKDTRISSDFSSTAENK